MDPPVSDPSASGAIRAATAAADPPLDPPGVRSSAHGFLAGPNAEFRSARWIRPEEFNLAWLPPMKRQAYRQVLQDFFGTAAEIKADSD